MFRSFTREELKHAGKNTSVMAHLFRAVWLLRELRKAESTKAKFMARSVLKTRIVEQIQYASDEMAKLGIDVYHKPKLKPESEKSKAAAARKKQEAVLKLIGKGT